MIARIIGAGAALVLLAGCGGKEPAAEAPSTGPDVEISGIGSGHAAPPANLPAFAPVYPGARVTTTTLDGQQPGKGMMTLAAPNADGAAILAFYKQKGEAAGLTAAMETATGDARVMAMSDGNASDSRGFQVTAAPDGEGGSIVTVVYSDASVAN